MTFHFYSLDLLKVWAGAGIGLALEFSYSSSDNHHHHLESRPAPLGGTRLVVLFYYFFYFILTTHVGEVLTEAEIGLSLEVRYSSGSSNISDYHLQ